MNTTQLTTCEYCQKQASPIGMNPRGKHICGPCIFSGIESLECWHCNEFKSGIAINPYVDQMCGDCLLTVKVAK